MGETVEYGGWRRCLRLANERVELIVTREVGPRVLRYGFVGGENEFREYPDQQGLTGGDTWRLYGGHRLWHAPEARPRTYQPDNDPVSGEVRARGARLEQPVEPATGIQKTLDLQLMEGSHVIVTHGLTNRGLWPITLAPWGITIVAPGSTAILPQPPGDGPEQLLPNRSVTLWPYTSPTDPRILWGERYLRVRADAAIAPPIKIGTQSRPGWCATVRAGHLFLKRVQFQPDAAYPDRDSGLECYTAGDFLELETLGPLVELEPGQSTYHVEHWFLFEGADAADEAAVDRTVLPRVRETDRALGH